MSAARRPRRWTPTPARLVLALGLLALIGAALAILLQSAPRRAGTNLTADAGYVVPLQAGGQLCEPGELVPGDTGALRLSVSSGAALGPPLDVTVGVGMHPIAVGHLAAGWHSGAVSIPVSRVRETQQGATICLVNRGSHSVSFGGSVPDADFYVVLDGKPLSGRMRVEYMRPGSESWLTLLGTLTHRFSLAKADVVRHWAAPAVLVLMLLAVVLAGRTILRAEPPK
ncbi:MAG TPA: hypothetical protein VGI52_01645 [Solirubrobacteraceae bacterium]